MVRLQCLQLKLSSVGLKTALKFIWRQGSLAKFSNRYIYLQSSLAQASCSSSLQPAVATPLLIRALSCSLDCALTLNFAHLVAHLRCRTISTVASAKDMVRVACGQQPNGRRNGQMWVAEMNVRHVGKGAQPQLIGGRWTLWYRW